jgi:hypothetical protein
MLKSREAPQVDIAQHLLKTKEELWIPAVLDGRKHNWESGELVSVTDTPEF